MSGKKETTIYDIAKKLGISASTVSRALKDNSAISDAMVSRIRNAAEKMGYRPNVFAASIRQNKTHTVGVLIPRITSEFMSKAVTSVQTVLNEAGYNIIISQSGESYEKEVENARTLFNSRVDGLIASLSYDTRDYSHFLPFIRKHIPLVFFDRFSNEVKGIKVGINNREAGYMATEHLISRGCERIAVLTGTQIRNVYGERVEGYKKALRKHGLHYDASLVWETPLTFESGKKSAADMLAMKRRPDGVFACNDASAIGCIMELKAKGLAVPEDVAVIGFNNDSASVIIDPHLSTIRYPVEEMATIAARRLLNAIENPGLGVSDEVISLETELIIRKSS